MGHGGNGGQTECKGRDAREKRATSAGAKNDDTDEMRSSGSDIKRENEADEADDDVDDEDEDEEEKATPRSRAVP